MCLNDTDRWVMRAMSEEGGGMGNEREGAIERVGWNEWEGGKERDR